MHKGDAHILEGLTMPMSMSLVNSAFTLASFSGERQRALADAGRPAVMMRCVTPWRFGLSLVHGVVRVLRELAQGLGVWVTSCERSRDTAQKLGDDVECSVLIRVPFLVSMRRLWSRSTSSLCCNRKSAPIMACTNRQVRERGSPKSRVHCW